MWAFSTQPTVSYKTLTHFKLLPSTVSAFLFQRLLCEQLPVLEIPNFVFLATSRTVKAHFLDMKLIFVRP